MANIIEKLVNNLKIKSLKNMIDEGNIEYVSFPKEINLKKITSKNDKKDYIIKAIKRGYKIRNSSPDYIKKNERYLNYFIEKLKNEIMNKNYNNLYDVYDKIIQNLNSDYILKAIDNGYDLLKESNEYIISNSQYIKYYIEKTSNVKILNRISEETLKKLCDEDDNLMYKYIDYSIKHNINTGYIGDLDIDYIVYYINNVQTINGDELYMISEEKWKELEEKYPDIISLSIKKSININENIPKFIKEKYETEIQNTVLKNIENREYGSLWELEDELLQNFAKNPEIVDKILNSGYKEIIYYTQNNEENQKRYLEKLLEKKDYLIDYINEITHKNFKTYNEFLFLNKYLTELLYEIEKQESFLRMYDSSELADEIYTAEEKLEELLKVTRISGVNIDYDTLIKIDFELIKKYKSKIYEELVLKEDNIFNIDKNSKVSALEAIGIFGLFEEDKIGVNIRINKLKEIINKIPNRITKDEYERILNDYSDKESLIKKSYNKVTGKKYVKKDDILIPSSLKFYENYFIEELNEKKYSFLKKLLPEGTIGSELNKFLKGAYEEQETIYYQLNDLTEQEQNEIRSIIQNSDIEGALTKHSLHKILSGCNQSYSKDFYDYFVKNIDLILNDETNQRNIKEIQDSFEEIKRESTTEQPTYAKTIEYICRPNYDKNITEDFINELKKAGVKSESASNYYYKLHKEASKITKTALPNYKKEYEETINNNTFKFRARRLEKKDPLLVLVGEKDYTNCCQTYNEEGQECNKYSALSQYGGIFITEVLINGKWTLLTQSWDWVNNDVYCHDNIEGTKTLKNHNEFKNMVLKMYEDHAKNIIEISKQTIKDYISKNSDEKTIEQLNNQMIKIVTVGTNYNDINIEKHYKRKVINTNN